MNHAKFIKDLGGGAAVGRWLRAKGIAVQDVTVRSWCGEGRFIPDGYWIHLREMADERGIFCTIEALARSVAIEPKEAA